MSKTFGAYVKERRKQLGFNQKQFAQRVRLSVTTVSKIESGNASDLKASHLFSIGDALKWTPVQTYRAFYGEDPYISQADRRTRELQRAFDDFIEKVRAIETL